MAQKNLKLDIIEKVLMLDTKAELHNVRELVSQAISRECDLEDQKEQEFKEWKENQVNV